MKKTGFILLILMALLLAGTAGAEMQANPRRQAASEAEALVRELCAPGGAGSVRPNDSQSGLKVNCVRNPSMNGTGSWTISLAGRSASQVDSMFCYLGCKDYSSEYTHVHWIEKERNSGETNPFMSSYTTPKIVTSGSYVVVFFVTFTDETNAWYMHNFTISGANALQDKINSVAAACRADTKWQTALNLHDWLTHNLYYDHSLQFYGADSILRGYGVCDSYSKIYLMLCKAAGIPVCRVENRTHAWNAIKLGSRWFYVDCTWDDPGTEKKKTSGSETRIYFGLNDELLDLDHDMPWTWTGAARQECTDLSANYYIHTGEWKDWGYSAYENALVPVMDAGTGVCTLPNIYTNAYQRILMTYGFRNMTVTLPDSERLRVSGAYLESGNQFSFRVTGWDIQETGTLTLPNKLKTVPDEAFAGSAATTVEIPAGCAAIGAGAFRNSGVRMVKVPESVTVIADDAFEGCGRIIFNTQGEAAVRYAGEHGFIMTCGD